MKFKVVRLDEDEVEPWLNKFSQNHLIVDYTSNTQFRRGIGLEFILIVKYYNQDNSK